MDPPLSKSQRKTVVVSLSLSLSHRKITSYGGFLKWWYPTPMGFPTKNDHFGVFWGYHHLRKHPYHNHVIFVTPHLCMMVSRENLWRSIHELKMIQQHVVTSTWFARRQCKIPEREFQLESKSSEGFQLQTTGIL